MATDYWASSQYKRWIVDRATLKHARRLDLQYVEDPEYLDFLSIFFANLISALGKKLQLRQRVIATATVFFRRFYLKNSYCETDPFIVIAACCYVAAKAEESPVHIKNVVTEARLIFGNELYGIKSFPSDNSKLAEMEFYLVDELECDLVVFHPYRTLMTLCGKEGASMSADTEAGEVGVGIQDGAKYWGSGEGKLKLQEPALQMAWFIINDTFRSDLCLLYAPHLIAIAAIYLTLVLHSGTREQLHLQQDPSAPNASPRRSSRSSNSAHHKKPVQDFVGFMAGLNVNMEIIASIAQEIISLYTLWERYKDDGTETTARKAFVNDQTRSLGGHKRNSSGALRNNIVLSGGTSSSCAGTHGDEGLHRHPHRTAHERPAVITPTFMTQLLLRMRENRMNDIAHPSSGRPIVYDKRLERAQAAG